MLLVITTIRKSTIPKAGQGLFADEFIPAGTVVWRLDKTVDQIVLNDTVTQYDSDQKQAFVHHAYQYNKTGDWIACFDGAQYMNHSEAPNLSRNPKDAEDDYSDIALRDIQKGEELFDNYYDYDLDAKRKLVHKE